MWNLPEPGIEPESPALAGRFLTTEPPGKSLDLRSLRSVLVKILWVCDFLEDWGVAPEHVGSKKQRAEEQSGKAHAMNWRQRGVPWKTLQNARRRASQFTEVCVIPSVQCDGRWSTSIQERVLSLARRGRGWSLWNRSQTRMGRAWMEGWWGGMFLLG